MLLLHAFTTLVAARSLSLRGDPANATLTSSLVPAAAQITEYCLRALPAAPAGAEPTASALQLAHLPLPEAEEPPRPPAAKDGAPPQVQDAAREQLRQLQTALLQEARAQGLAKYEGFNDECLRVLKVSARDANAGAQLQRVLRQAVARGQVQRAPNRAAAATALQRLRDPRAPLAAALARLPPLRYTTGPGPAPVRRPRPSAHAAPRDKRHRP